jgi:GDP-D-mannose dehydratase
MALAIRWINSGVDTCSLSATRKSANLPLGWVSRWTMKEARFSTPKKARRFDRAKRKRNAALGCTLAFAEVGRGIEWRGKGVDETGVDKKSGKTVVRIVPVYFRPTEADLLIGDSSKARKKLGWQP